MTHRVAAGSKRARQVEAQLNIIEVARDGKKAFMGAKQIAKARRRVGWCADGTCGDFRNMNGGCDKCGAPSL